ncbi:MAG TPA: bifunctional YncE family protein/alkaline phosphatase family protein [Gemmatimonadaceae bacterium]
MHTSMRSFLLHSLACVALLGAAACSTGPVITDDRGARATTDDSPGRLPTGVRLDPATPLHDVGQMPLAMIASPEGDRLVLLLNGWRDEGIQVVDRASGKVLQTVKLPAAFLGLVFSIDGKTLYASGGNTDVVYAFDWANSAATLRDSIVLQMRTTPRANGVRYPAGLAVSRDGRQLYVAENLVDSLAVVDLATGRVTQRLATDRYPYAVAVSPEGGVYVSNWGGQHVSTYASASGALRSTGRILVGRHPSALLMNARGNRLFVALASVDRVVSVDLLRRRVIGELLDPPPSGPGEGSTPNALALSADGGRLFVAEGDANAVAVFDLTPSTSGIATSAGDDRLTGRIPTGWYPTAVLTRDDELIVASGKGRGTRANPDGPGPIAARDRAQPAGQNTTLSQLSGTVMSAALVHADRATLDRFSSRVALANGWTEPRSAARGYPPIEHVIYIVKENRTYDQVLGDLTQADGDTSLAMFPRSVTPNQHALAERFGIFDRFFVNAEVSADGHNWSMAAYATDYVEKTVQLNYSQRGRNYDYEGTQSYRRGLIPDDDVNAPARGYLWDLIAQKGLTFRNYGEFVVPSSADSDDVLPAGYRGNKPFLAAHTNPAYPGFDLTIPDQRRADVWLAEFAEFSRRGVLPAMEIVRLPNNHTAAMRAGAPTPRAMVADNDLALGRMIEALSKSPFWKSTVVFVLEDDAQNGPDHVDSHRSPMIVISPYVRAGVVHRFTNTTDALRTMEELLGLDALSQFDYFGRPLRDIWSKAPVDRPFTALTPSVNLLERNPAGTTGARESLQLDLRIEDAADEGIFNHILWKSVRPGVPYPGTRRGAALEAIRGR